MGRRRADRVECRDRTLTLDLAMVTQQDELAKRQTVEELEAIVSRVDSAEKVPFPAGAHALPVLVSRLEEAEVGVFQRNQESRFDPGTRPARLGLETALRPRGRQRKRDGSEKSS